MIKKSICPACGRKVGDDHFSCRSGALGGRIGGKAAGATKRRGDAEHHRQLAAMRKDRAAKKATRGTH